MTTRLDLRAGKAGNIETLFEQWAKHIPDLLSVNIYTEDHKKIAAFQSNHYSENVVHYTRELPGETPLIFNAVLDLTELQQKHNDYLLIVAFANLMLAFLMMYLMWVIMQSYVFVPMRKSEKELTALANHDSLTHVNNRRHFTENSNVQIERCQRLKKPLCMVMFDLDHFKDVNDYYGHAIGDLVLVLFSNEVQLQIRNYDILGRSGGEEFAVCLPDLSLQSAMSVVERIIETFSELPTLEGKKPVHLTVSAGVTELRSDDSYESSLQRADDAMYQAKQAGRNTYSFYTPSLTREANAKLDLEARLRRAQSQDEFVLHYQPQVQINTGCVIGCEALLRWNSPEQGMISPASFIPLAEETGLIVPLGAWVLSQACAQAKMWHDAGLGDVGELIRPAIAPARHCRQRRRCLEWQWVASRIPETGTDRKHDHGSGRAGGGADARAETAWRAFVHR